MADLSGIGSIASAGSGLLGGIFGAISQRNANKMNLKINQMNNEFNERMMNKQMAWQEEMWNKQNAYNTPEAMKQRYREAGLNPGLMFSGSGAAGVASSVGGVSGASAAGNAIMQPYRFDTSSLSSALAGIDEFFFRKRNQNLINEGLDLDNQYKRASLMDRLNELKNRVDSGSLQNEFQKMLNEQARLTFDSNVEAINERNAREKYITEQERINTALSTLLYTNQEHWYKNFGTQSNVLRYLSQVYAVEQQGLTKKETEAKIANLYADYTGKTITNDIMRDTKDSTIKAVNAMQLYQAGVFDGLDVDKYVSARNLENQSVADFINNYSGAERAKLEKARAILENQGLVIKNARELVQGLQDAKRLIMGDTNVAFSFGPVSINKTW